MTATAHILTADTQAILLLSGGLGQERGPTLPLLTPSEYHELAQLLHRHQLRPADLLASGTLSRLRELEPLQFDSERITLLLSRGAALGLAVESWGNRGVWVLSRSDPQYPTRLRVRLGKSAPPILYGVGSQELLSAGGLAIVGSREIDDTALRFTKALAMRCMRDAVQVVSGGARGVDMEAMLGTLEAGGTAIGVLAESLLKAAVTGKYRAALRDGRLALITAYEPDVGFSVGNAMGRNKQIYALSDYACVVSASLETGGTWSGAIENLKRQWIPLFVYAAQPMSPGNQALLERGAVAFAEPMLASEQPLSDWLEQHGSIGESSAHGAPASHAEIETAPAPSNEPFDLFRVIWPYLAEALQREYTDHDLAAHFGIELAQMRGWLQRAVSERLAIKLSKPVRYVAAPAAQQADMLALLS